jgi:hypothetical protein
VLSLSPSWVFAPNRIHNNRSSCWIFDHFIDNFITIATGSSDCCVSRHILCTVLVYRVPNIVYRNLYNGRGSSNSNSKILVIQHAVDTYIKTLALTKCCSCVELPYFFGICQCRPSINHCLSIVYQVMVIMPSPITMRIFRTEKGTSVPVL